jgi:hypothetical protein
MRIGDKTELKQSTGHGILTARQGHFLLSFDRGSEILHLDLRDSRTNTHWHRTGDHFLGDTEEEDVLSFEDRFLIAFLFASTCSAIGVQMIQSMGDGFLYSIIQYICIAFLLDHHKTQYALCYLCSGPCTDPHPLPHPHPFLL